MYTHFQKLQKNDDNNIYLYMVGRDISSKNKELITNVETYKYT